MWPDSNPDDMTAANLDTSWNILPSPAPLDVSPHVNQFLTDYAFAHQKLTDIGARVDLEHADVVLSIVNDAYNHERMSKLTSEQLWGNDSSKGMPVDYY